MPRLIVFGPSHFGERARWGLDHTEIGYREERWLPGPHAILAKRLGLRATTTPILVPDDGPPVQGSDHILDWARVPGSDPDLEMRFQERIGPLVRQLVYAVALGVPGSGVREALFEGVSPRQSFAGRLMWPVTQRLMVIGMQARVALVPKLVHRLDEELAWFAGVLQRCGDHLVDNAFGRADLTAASLLAPLAMPRECPVAHLYERVRLPGLLEDALYRWRSEPALAWVARTYAQHRRRRPARDAVQDRDGRRHEDAR